MSSKISDEDFEHGKRAIEAMKRLCRSHLEPLVQAVVKNNKIRVEPHASRSFTNGRSVFIATPWELGETLEHDKSLCGKRDFANDNLMECPACRRLDEILADAFHETAHITEDSFETVTGEEILKAVREVFGPIWDGLDPGKRSLLEYKIGACDTVVEACNYIDTWLGLIANVVEDIHVNRRLGEKRPGTLVQLASHARKIIRQGSSTASGTILWQDAPKDAQAFLPAYLIGAGLADMRSLLPDVEELFDDPEIERIMTSIPGDSGTVDRLRLSMELLNRYRELGYMPRKSDSVMPPPPEPEEEDEPEEAPEPPEGEAGDDSEDEGEPCDDGEAGDSDDGDDQAGDDDSDEDDDSDDKSGSDDESDAEDDEESDEESDSTDDGEATESDDKSDEDGDDAEDGDEAESDDEGSADSSDAEGETSEMDEDEDDDDEAAQGDEPCDDGDEGDDSDDDSGQAGDDDEDEADDDDDDGDDGDSAPGSTESDDEGEHQESDDGEAGNSDKDDDDSDDDEAGDSDEDDDSQDGDAHEQGTDDDEEADDVDDGDDEDEGESITGSGDISDPGANDLDDSDATEDDDGEPEEEERKAMTDEEIEESARLSEELIKAFTGHDSKPPPTTEEKDQQRALERVFDQSHFDQPSDWCLKAEIVTRDECRSEFASRPLVLPEAIISGKLARLRVVFAQNRKTGLERNLRTGPRLDAGHLHRIPADDPRFFARRNIPKTRDWFVTIGLDFSGSTGSNGALHPTKLAGMAMAEMLSRLGIAFTLEVHASEDRHNGAWNPVEEEYGWNLRHVIIKSPEEPWTPDCKLLLTGLQDFGCNLDGHSMERYRKIAQARRETDKLIIYFTDGAMPMFNYAEEKEILEREIMLLRRLKIPVVGVGYQTDSPRQYGLETIIYEHAEDVPSIVAGLERHLSKPL